MLNTKISRQLYIISILKSKTNGFSKTEIMTMIEGKFKCLDDNFTYIDITFKRDIKDLRNDFGIDIKYNKKDNIYELDNLQIDDSRIDLLLNSFKIFTTFLNQNGLPEYILTEKRKPDGLEHFSIITEAINEKKYIEFEYLKFDTNLKEQKKVKPLVIMESKSRWYLIGTYENKEEIRAFGLDRISNLFSVNQKYNSKLSINTIKENYKDSFAMFTDGVVEKVLISLDVRDGNYINSYPIHPTQKCEFVTEKNRYFVALEIKISLDFIMELMSRAWSLEVIQPAHLRQQISNIFEEASIRNK